MRRPFHRGTLFAGLVGAVVALMPWLSGDALAQESLRLDLDKVVHMATAHNRKTKMREDEANAAVYRRKQAIGRFLPKLSLSARYSRVSHVEPGSLSLPAPNDPSAINTAQLGEAVDNQYSLRLSVDQPIFTGFALWNGYQATEHAEALAQQRVRAERADVRAVAQETYFNVLKAREMRNVTEQLVQALEEHLQQIRLIYDAGRATELDVSRVQSRVAAARVSLVQIRGAEDGAHLALATLLGIPSTTALELADMVDTKTPESLPGAAQLVAEAFASRPEIAIAKEGAAMATARVEVEGSALWPQVSVRFGYNYERPNQRYFPVQDRFDGSWDISAIASWTAWDWGVTYYGMKAAQAEASAAARNVDEARDAVRLDVERQRQGYTTAAAKITAARQALSSAERAYDAAKILFDAGRAESLDVLDAATELTRARSDLVQSLADARVAWAYVQKAAGRD
ncbi:MAG: TolC family protein [Deltaproteobacteria bacterium]|nr:TolC family protein [Deltaproteobacteria bacterium]